MSTSDKIDDITRMVALLPSLASVRKVRAIVHEQAEDEGLWFVAETASEAYLQQELRKLHAAIEDMR